MKTEFAITQLRVSITYPMTMSMMICIGIYDDDDDDLYPTRYEVFQEG